MKEQSFGPIRFLPGPQKGRYPHCHSLYIEEAGILIDPASDRNRLEELHRHGGVREVWLSHWHEDHFTHLDLFDDLPLRISREDAPPLANIDLFLDWYGIEGSEVESFWKPLFLNNFHFRPRRPAHFLQGGQIIDLAGTKAEFISTPGHTPGHLAINFPEMGLLFLGDYDLTSFGPWYGDRYSSIEETIYSLEHLRKIPAYHWLTSHETGIFREPLGDLWDRYADVIRQREERLLSFLREPRTLAEIVAARIIYGKAREPLTFFVFAERAMLRKHLEYAQRRGLIDSDNGRTFRTL